MSWELELVQISRYHNGDVVKIQSRNSIRRYFTCGNTITCNNIIFESFLTWQMKMDFMNVRNLKKFILLPFQLLSSFRVFILLVLGTIAGCLFPLWPGWLKKGVYYTSLGGLICFGILLGIAFGKPLNERKMDLLKFFSFFFKKLVDLFGTLKLIKYIKYKNILFFFLLLLTFYILLLSCIIFLSNFSARTVLFVVIWTATMGRHKLWILPNLTEDCGFFESFQPWYTYEYCPDGIKKRKKGEKKKTGEEPQRGFAYYAAMNYTFYCSELYFILSFKLNIYYRAK